jgi:hypothetical protein
LLGASAFLQLFLAGIGDGELALNEPREAKLSGSYFCDGRLFCSSGQDDRIADNDHVREGNLGIADFELHYGFPRGVAQL